MTAFLLSLLSSFGPYILLGITALFGAFKWRSSIIRGERAKQAEAENAARDIADQVDNDVGAMPPADARKELSKWSK